MEKINIIRFADEGFKDYKNKIKVDGKYKEVEGCYAFIRKSFKGALKYNYPVYNNGQLLKNRDKDKKHIIHLDEEFIVYGRLPKVENIYFLNKGKHISLDEVLNSNLENNTITLPCKLNWCSSEDFKEVRLGELNNALIEFENILNLIKNKGYKVKKNEPIYSFYEIFIDKDIIQNQILNKANKKEV